MKFPFRLPFGIGGSEEEWAQDERSRLERAGAIEPQEASLSIDDPALHRKLKPFLEAVEKPDWSMLRKVTDEEMRKVHARFAVLDFIARTALSIVQIKTMSVDEIRERLGAQAGNV